MKFIITFLVCFILNSGMVFCQDSLTIKNSLKEDQFELDELVERIAALNKKNQILIDRLNKMQFQIRLNENLLNKFSGDRSSLLSEFAIFVTVLISVFGLVGFFTVYLPSQKHKKDMDNALDGFRNNMNDHFSKYLMEIKDRMIDDNLKVIEENQTNRISTAVAYLRSIYLEGFNTNQLYRMRAIVLEADSFSENEIWLEVFGFMIYSESGIVEKTCSFIIKKEFMLPATIYSLIYFAKHDIHKYDGRVIEVLNEKTDKWTTVIADIMSCSDDYLVELWNQYGEDINNNSMDNLSNSLKFYYQEKRKKDKSVRKFLDKVKESKFGKIHENDKLNFLFAEEYQGQ